jgi:diphthamide synthase (EF-2-diphthine--ammonia ligase)
LKEKGVEFLAFGDIHLKDLRKYREDLVNRGGLKAYFPIWNISTLKLMNNFIANDFKAITCCINTSILSADWLGRELDTNFIADIPTEVDLCGENGEYHTFCYAGPIFKNSIPYQTGEIVFKPLKVNQVKGGSETGFLFLDIN